MMHNPRSFLPLPANTAPVAIAGHTHGGQIRLPLTPQWSWLTVTKEMEHVDGWSHGYGASGNQLYVNRGIGFSEVPLRINCPPEVTIFTLQSQ
jgi:predicted MPP superfamily phosphohydrolase